MAIDFPNSPSVGQLFTTGDITRRWDGVTWSIVPTTIQGVTGAKGLQGTTGIQGIQGLQGTAGKFSTGTTAPVSPSIGDVWFNTEDAIIYVYYDGYWVEWSSATTGAQGITGSQGTVGLQGTQGIIGPSGVDAVTTQTGSTYTFVIGDKDNLVRGNSSSAQTFSIPTNASVSFAIGDIINVAQIGVGQITINAVTPATTTIASTGAISTSPKLRAQYSVCSLIKVENDIWYVTGDIE